MALRRSRRLVSLIGLCTLATVLGQQPAATAETTTATAPATTAVPAFYTPPDTLPETNGALIRTEPLDLALSLPGIDGTLPGTATRVMYKTTDSRGEPAAVTGAYLEPVADWTGGGPRPLVVVAPGTMGQGDRCAASLGLEKMVVLEGGAISVGYENLAIYTLLSRGVAVMETDYIGLGTTDRLHTYTNSLDEGHAVLDAARAARSLTGTSLTPSSPVALFGYSQGGGAVASAAELQSGYAPEIPLEATYAGAPPADLARTTAVIDGTELVGALAWAVNGFVQSEPLLQPMLDKYLSPEGADVLADLSTSCTFDAIANYSNQQSSTWTTNGQPLADIIAAEPLLRDFVAAQRIGTRTPTGAVLISTGVSDDLVPHGQARDLAVDWCQLGGNVVYNPIRLPASRSPLINHMVPMFSGQGDAVDWVVDRLSGKTVSSTCSTIGAMP